MSFVNKLCRLAALVAVGVLAGCASTPADPPPPPPMVAQDWFNVGMVTRDYVDDRRQNWERTGPRPLRTAVWYPAPTTSAMTEMVTAGLFVGGPVAPDAPLDNSRRRFPLVLLSHGTGGSAVQMMWLGRRLAARGYIVAAVNHHGNTGAEKQHRAQGFLLYWERARDLSRVLDAVLADPKFGPRIDARRIGAAGFSLGGFTALLVGGARFSSEQYDAFCASPARDFTCEPQPEYPAAHKEFAQLRGTDAVVIESLRHSDKSYRDPRIRAVFAIAPALGSGLTEASLKGMPVPVELAVGSADVTTPPATNAALLAKLVPGAKIHMIPAATHYTFLDACTPQGVELLELCRDAAGLNREDVHADVTERVRRFFEKYLR